MQPIPSDIQAAYGLDPAASAGVVHIPSLINRTFLVHGDLGAGPRKMILQALHPVFAAHVHLDIEAVTQHLAARQVETPRLLRNRSGELWTIEAAAAEPRVWRALTYLDGVTVHRTRDMAQLSSAAELLGRFHGALFDLEHSFVHVRPVHDTRRHLDKLEAALRSERARSDPDAQALGAQVLRHAEQVRLDYSALARRAVHGDPKLSNVLFHADDPARARCMIDLDTMGVEYLAYELGDALRSWGNCAGEDTGSADFDPEALRALIAGYTRSCPSALPRAEILSAVDGLETVALELASRFAADAILDCYFGWDASRFPSRRAHNLVRARGQLALSSDVRSRKDLLCEIAAHALSS
ncbi:MAG TPA: phosphotransferase [Polyangiaceae bacterium]|nr:phosphotransferase [Polyangiaceae bacterium]